MANLRNFLWSGLTDGTQVDFYLNRTPKIGSGVVVTARPLNLVVEAEISLVPGRNRAEIIMPDEGTRGTCTVIVNRTRHDACPYWVDGAYLNIEVPGGKLAIGGVGDRMWTWCWAEFGIVRSWIGTWPAGREMPAGEAELALEPMSA